LILIEPVAVAIACSFVICFIIGGLMSPSSLGQAATTKNEFVFALFLTAFCVGYFSVRYVKKLVLKALKKVKLIERS
jgi:membrane-bound ClpP family serine protease